MYQRVGDAERTRVHLRVLIYKCVLGSKNLRQYREMGMIRLFNIYFHIKFL